MERTTKRRPPIYVLIDGEAVLPAVREALSTYPETLFLDAADLGTFLYEKDLLPFRPLLVDVHAALEMLALERGEEDTEDIWPEARLVFNLKTVVIRGGARVRCSARVT